MPRVTIDVIATELGVSRQTVSRAMNNAPDISDATRARILEASERMGYKPSRFASNLARSSRSTAIGFVVESFRNPFYSELIAEFLDVATSRHWQVAISSHEGTPDLELVGRLADNVDVIVGYLSDPHKDIARAARGTPVVLIDQTSSTRGVHGIEIDFDAGIESLIAGLRARGSRRFGLLESQDLGTEYRKSTRRLAYERHADDESARSVVVCEAGPQSLEAGAHGFDRLMADYPETDTVIAFSDLMAMGALAAAGDSRINVPDDVRVVGIDGLALGQYTRPPLSSLGLVGSLMTKPLTDLIDLVLAREAGDHEHRVVTPHPIWRRSSGDVGGSERVAGRTESVEE